MNIEFSTSSERSPLEVLDVQVSAQRSSGPSLLSLRFLCRSDRFTDVHVPTLSWFDASQLERFSQQVASTEYPDTCQVDLLDAGVRLTGSVRRLAGVWTTGRTIRIEPLETAVNPFSPFTLHASHRDVKKYAGKLYQRLWELFTKG
ncbi:MULTISPECIES: hypothetical protein [unclassified Spirosoma]|uniref:hypothetical protein n=1 Tax=unclassified Spirosoma TaxID=2621999 RepID=UPI000961B13C|nr:MULTISPECIES: hypothetical protein [unclassified Spirosoma]MBN8822466.1 hypothetical protein [Spirosoma sp.]OJW73976.1 MAG: hypothetical protein BGO59_12595 [Spirosoma sp. 48-14]